MAYGSSPLELLAAQAVLQGVIWTDDFIYSGVWSTANNNSLGALATVDVQILTDGASDFIIQERNITAYDNAGTPALVQDPNFLVTIIRGGSGREVMNQPQHVQNLLGNYQVNKQPGKMQFTTLIPNAQILTIKLQNLTSTVFSRVDLALVGFKVFYIQNSAGVVGTRRSVFNLQF